MPLPKSPICSLFVLSWLKAGLSARAGGEVRGRNQSMRATKIRAGRGAVRRKSAFMLQRHQVILEAAEVAGLLDPTRKRLISARLSRRLVNAAKRRAGIRSDVELLVFALAVVALC